jgi:hypothetical protein
LTPSNFEESNPIREDFTMLNPDRICTEDGGAPEIEITQEMIDAGEDVLLGELGGAVSSHWSAPDLAKQVFSAMASCRLPKRRRYRERIGIKSKRSLGTT